MNSREENTQKKTVEKGIFWQKVDRFEVHSKVIIIAYHGLQMGFLSNIIFSNERLLSILVVSNIIFSWFPVESIGHLFVRSWATMLVWYSI